MLLFSSYIVLYGGKQNPFVVIVDRYGENFLGLLLADHVLVEVLLDLLGSRNVLFELGG